jgi:hypothetical protein
MDRARELIKAFNESNIVNLRVKYGEKNEEKSLDEMITTCDICGKTIIGVENFINAGDKVVCSENCKQTAIGQFRHWQETESHNWRKA